jgi:hypothetical protein
VGVGEWGFGVGARASSSVDVCVKLSRSASDSFMQRKRGQADFDMSEPEFLISVMDRHPDWCTVVCLVGGGQEIHTGEAGISEWINALEARFSHWEVHVSPRIALPEYGSQIQVEKFLASPRVRSSFYDSTFKYLLACGIPILD